MKIRPINKPPSSISDFIEIFVIRDETPSTNMIFKIFEPITLPMSKSYFPLFIDAREVKSSGNEVPRATIENPIFNSLTPIILEIFKALSTIRLVPIDSPNIDISIIKELCNKLF